MNYNTKGSIMRAVRIGLVGALIAALALLAPSASAAAGTITVNGQTRNLDGINVRRLTNYLVKYTPAFGASTQTNIYGYEAAVVGGKVTKVANGVGNMAIPANGFVLSGHGTSRTWLRTNAVVGATVSDGTVTPPPTPPTTTKTPLLPDVGIRTLRLFTIVNSGGAKLLKFPGVTPNIGDGPLEIRATRASSTATNWAAHQMVFNTDGSTTMLPDSGAEFYFAGDGHSHWHIRDFDKYEILNPAGTSIKIGEKHGFCFEDNTSYRDWPGNPKHPASPANAVYTPSNVCGVGQPNATSITHGLSVGWGDTYPASLPDQAIDITGLPDGRYMVKVTADWQNFWREKNENNNSASAQIEITGNTVTLVSATDGM